MTLEASRRDDAPLSVSGTARPGGLRRLASAVVWEVHREVGLRRWLLVMPGFALGAFSRLPYVQFDYETKSARVCSAWDLLPAVLSERHLVLWWLGLGFSLVAGDSLYRARLQAGAALTLMRAPSRSEWWAGRLLALGLQALLFVVLGSFGALLVGVWELPFATDPALHAACVRGLYPPLPGAPMPLVLLAFVLYSAFAVWLFGCFLSAVALVSRHPAAPYLVGMAWILASLIDPFNTFGTGAWGRVDLGRFLTLASWLDGPHSLGPGPFLLACLLFLGGVLALGAWRLGRAEL